MSEDKYSDLVSVEEAMREGIKSGELAIKKEIKDANCSRYAAIANLNKKTYKQSMGYKVLHGIVKD